VVEVVYDEQQRLVVIDFEVLVDDPFQLQRVALRAVVVDAMDNLSVRREQPRTVHLEVTRGGTTHQAELHREPEEALQRILDTGQAAQLLCTVGHRAHQFGGQMRAGTKADQCFRERRIRVHWHMPGDVMKDIGLRQVIE
jgi:hypothetical protein